jgi:hypothetical protein
MRGLWNRLGTANKVGLIGAMLGFTAGLVVVVVVRPVAGLVIAAFSIGLTAFCFWFFFGREARRSRILTSGGEKAKATILEVRSTGVTVNEVYPQIELLLEIHPENADSYQVKNTCLIDQVDIPSFQPGDTITVVVDPKDRTQVAVGLSSSQV